MTSNQNSLFRRIVALALICCAFLSLASSTPVDAQEPRRKDKAANMSWVDLHKKYPTTFIMNGSRQKKQVALTFDDAPDPRYTPAILDVLAKYKVRATFFVVGVRASKHPALVKRMQKEGHVIGNHSYDHAVFSSLSLASYRRQIIRTDEIIKNIVGYSPRFIRPPYGELLSQQVRWSKEAGFTVVNWDVDSEDWRNNPSSARVISNIKRTLQPGSIILQHAGGGTGQSLNGTLEALPKLITMLRKDGYEIVTLPELLGKKKSR